MVNEDRNKSVSVCKHVFAGVQPTFIGNDMGFLTASCDCKIPFSEQVGVNDIRTIHLQHITQSNNTRNNLNDLPANAMGVLGDDGIWQYENYPNNGPEDIPLSGRRWMIRQETMNQLLSPRPLFALRKPDGALASLFLSGGLEMLGVWVDETEAIKDAGESSVELKTVKIDSSDLNGNDSVRGLVEIRWSEIDYQLIVPINFVRVYLGAF